MTEYTAGDIIEIICNMYVTVFNARSDASRIRTGGELRMDRSSLEGYSIDFLFVAQPLG